MMIILWHRVIDFQKMNGLFCLNHHIQDKMCDVTPVTENGQRMESGKLSRFFFWKTRNRKTELFLFHISRPEIEWRRSFLTLRLKKFKFDKVLR